MSLLTSIVAIVHRLANNLAILVFGLNDIHALLDILLISGPGRRFLASYPVSLNLGGRFSTLFVPEDPDFPILVRE